MPAKTAKRRPHKKPYTDFPLSAHASGYRRKKHRGKDHDLREKWCSPEDALAEFHCQWPAILECRDPEREAGELTLRTAANIFLTDRQRRVKIGRISQETFDEYRRTTDKRFECLGKDTSVDDLRPSHVVKLLDCLTRSHEGQGVAHQVQPVRAIFNFLYDSDALDRHAKCGPTFSRPSAREINAMIDDAPPAFRAMI